VARAEFLPPYSRAAATGLHRLPDTESAVNVAERRRHRLAGTLLLRVNEFAERPCKRAPRKKIEKVLQHLAEPPASKEAGYSKTPPHLQTL
jgi:hypothetical protein